MFRLFKRKQNSRILRVNGVSCDPPIAVLSLGNGIPNGEGVNVNLPVGDAFTPIDKGVNVRLPRAADAHAVQRHKGKKGVYYD